VEQLHRASPKALRLFHFNISVPNLINGNRGHSDSLPRRLGTCSPFHRTGARVNLTRRLQEFTQRSVRLEDALTTRMPSVHKTSSILNKMPKSVQQNYRPRRTRSM